MVVTKKPVRVEAVQYLGLRPDAGTDETVCACEISFSEPTPQWLSAALRGGAVTVSGMFTDSLAVATREGDMTCNKGDWIVRGVKGELYPVAPDIFNLTYDLPPAPAP